MSYLFDVLSTNFPEHRTIWDLHHYFNLGGDKVDVQFDISLFLNFNLDEDLPSYDSTNFNDKTPDLVINILSKSTWRKDLSEIQELCRALKIPLYIIFMAYPLAPRMFTTPFARVYSLDHNNIYTVRELNEYTIIKGEFVNNNARIALNDKIPFDIGIEKLSRTYLGKKERSRLILLKKGAEEKLNTKYESEKQRAEQEKQRADMEKERADMEKERADMEKERADKLEEKIRKLQKNDA